MKINLRYFASVREAVARTTAWREFSERSDNCAKLMALAEQSIVVL